MEYRNMLPFETMQLIDFTYHALYVAPDEKPFERDILYTPEINKYYANFDVERELCVVAEDNFKLVGAIWGRVWDRDVKGYGYYDSHYVELTMSIIPQYRGQSIGTHILHKFIEEMRKTSYKGISLSVSYGNFAKELYEKVGFKVVEERDTDILMVLELNND